MIRILTLTSLFPNAAQPAHGIFVRQRLKHLINSQDVGARVVAPVPWYPKWLPGPESYRRYCEVPNAEPDDGFDVVHPRYLVLPKIGMSAAPALMAASILSTVRRAALTEPRCHLVDAHYFYPDGVAAAWIADKLGLPLVITARGTDINLIPEYAIPRRQILWAAGRASAIIAVCDALRDEMIDLGVDAAKITTLRNGYDPAMFHAVDRDTARSELGISGRVLLSVGHLIERKGHHIAIGALAGIPDMSLVIVGTGPMEAVLREQVRRLGLDERVRFEGAVEQTRLKSYYSACDALVLASSREGMANVLIEAIACGCPVVATDSWGTPEVITSRDAGVLVAERTEEGFAVGIRDLFSRLPDRDETRRYGRSFLWDPTSQGQLNIFQKLVDDAERTSA